MSIYDFTPEELEEIRKADREMDKRRGRPRRGSSTHPGNPVWEYRRKLGITQHQLSERMRISERSISGMERGTIEVTPYALGWIEAHPLKGEGHAGP